ncbi:hypothetical protein DFP72DRAFT_526448 [Ephemerocybe angulata]|uniref:Uncharacterized protein n=1 Tax=Ephemerocybe angulata TaxID=980116 RepID=A0A8H6MBK6_9AGAR|nr:hypothetical protein DFP72DRAFT_526448 [Tulosesus angulatus]
MKRGILPHIRDQFATIAPVAKADLTGKTVVVVGANTGLGFETVKHFARMKPGKIVLACRNEAKGKAALDKLQEDTGYITGELWLIDLTSFASVVAFVDRYEREGGRLDILVANAGVVDFKYKETIDGWEETLQVNSLSTSLICMLLAPRMAETAKTYSTQPRIVIVGSEAHYWTAIPDEVYDAPSSFKLISSKDFSTPQRMMQRYHDSKLLSVFFTLSLAELLKNSPIIVNTVNPGVCHSELNRSFTGVLGALSSIMLWVMGRTAEQGARSIVWAAVGAAENPDKLRGRYLNLDRLEEPSDHVCDVGGRKRQGKLWKDLIEELSKVDKRVPGVVEQFS